MSTKIYNGYMLEGVDLNLFSPAFEAFCENFRAKIQEAAHKLRCEKAAELCADIIDAASLQEAEAFKKGFNSKYETSYEKRWREKGEWSGKSLEWGSFHAALAYMEDRWEQIEITSMRDHAYDFSCSVLLIPSNGKVLATLFSEQDEYNRIWEETEGVKPYPYWNNADKPDDLSEEQWRSRREEWERALGKTGIPALRGLKLDCVIRPPRPKPEEVAALIPSFDKRVKKRAKERVLNRKAAELWEKEGRPQSYGCVYDAMDWLHTEEGEAEIASEREKLKGLLERNITADTLTRAVESFLHSEKP